MYWFMHFDLFINWVIKFTKSDNYCITIINNIIIIIAVGGILMFNLFVYLFIRADDTQIIIIYLLLYFSSVVFLFNV